MASSDSISRPIGFPLTISVFAALVLTLVSLPDALYYFWPDWMLLVVIFWSYSERDAFGPGHALPMGILLDVLYVKTFGVLSLGFVLIAFIVNQTSHQLKAMTSWQQCFMVGLLAAIFKLLTGWLYGIVEDFSFTLPFWYSIIGSMVAWPFVTIILSGLRRFTRVL